MTLDPIQASTIPVEYGIRYRLIAGPTASIAELDGPSVEPSTKESTT